MQTPGLSDDYLQRETERQNRIYRETLELKKEQTRPKEAADELFKPSFAEPLVLDEIALEIEDTPSSASAETASVTSTRTPAAQADVAPSASESLELTDKVISIPHIRSALIPLRESEQTVWSKPFSLRKIEMEPWLSYLKGYRQSRLFLEPSFANGNVGVDDDSELHIEFAVRALLELKDISPSAIFDPMVQISGQVEYMDVEAEVRTCRDPRLAQSLAQAGNDAHQKQIAKAFDQGREMGNQLHDILLGEGHVNLIKAWEHVHARKPSLQELHWMLTTGRVKLSDEPPATVQSSIPVSVRPVLPEVPSEEVADTGAVTSEEQQQAPPVLAQHEELRSKINAAKVFMPQPGASQAVKNQESLQSRKRKLLLYTVQAALAIATVVAYGYSLFDLLR